MGHLSTWPLSSYFHSHTQSHSEIGGGGGGGGGCVEGTSKVYGLLTTPIF